MRRGVLSRWGISTLWSVLAVASLFLAQRLPSVAVGDPFRFFPDDAPIRTAAAALRERFPGSDAASRIVLVVETRDGTPVLPRARAPLEQLVSRLRRELAGGGALPILAATDDPVLERRLASPDGGGALVVVPLAVGFASEEASALVARVEAIVADETSRGTSPLRVSLTGDGTLGRDYLVAIGEGGQRSGLATALLVAGTLLLVHRSVGAALVTLVTLGAALAVSLGAVTLAAELGMPFALQARGFLVALVYGVGTDYALLFLARLREARRSAEPGGTWGAVRASLPVLATSAAAVALACGLMGFARFGLFSSAGPALAISVLVTLAAVTTLAPALAEIAGRRLFGRRGESASPFGARVWPAIARLALGRPILVSVVALALVAPLAWGGRRIAPSFEVELDIPKASPSEAGWAALGRHFRPSQVVPLTMAFEADGPPGTLRTMAGLAALHGFTEALAREPGVVRVYAATRPTGEAGLLERGTLRNQLAELDAGISRAKTGAGRLAEGLEAARRDVGRGKGELAGKRAALDAEAKGSLIAAFVPDRIAAAKRDLARLDEQLGRLDAGLGEAAAGARSLEAGLETGVARLDALGSAPEASQALSLLALTPDDLARTPELERAFSYYLSPDARAARLELELATPPNAPASVALADRLRVEAPAMLRALGLPGAHVWLVGPTAITADLAALAPADLERLALWITGGVFLLLVLLLRSVTASLAVTAFILLSYLAALGALALLVAQGVWPGLDWKTPFFLFVLLVAIGADYGVFVLGRAREEARALPYAAALARALEATGPVVTSCGLVLAGTFATLLLSRLAFLEQVGVGITVGVLIDTCIVRPFLLPAAALLLARGEGGVTHVVPR